MLRPLVALGFAVFLTAFLPAALACEMSAQSQGSCLEPCRHASRGAVHCAGESALSSTPLPKKAGAVAPVLAEVGPVPALATGRPVTAPAGSSAFLRGPPPLSHSTLYAQGTLLRI